MNNRLLSGLLLLFLLSSINSFGQVVTAKDVDYFLSRLVNPFFERLENISHLPQDHDDFDVLSRDILKNYFSKDGLIFNDLTGFKGDSENIPIESYIDNVNFYYRNENEQYRFDYDRNNIAASQLVRVDVNTIDIFIDKKVNATYDDLDEKKKINIVNKCKVTIQWQKSKEDARIVFIKKDDRQEYKNATPVKNLANARESSKTLSDLANELAGQITAGLDVITREVILYPFTYQNQDVVNDFSVLFKTILKSNLQKRGVTLTAATRSFAAKVFTVKGNYAKSGDKLKLSVQILDENMNVVYSFDKTDLNWDDFNGLVPDNQSEAENRNKVIGPNNSSTGLQMLVYTNKGEGSQQFREGERMKLYVKASKPSYLRVLYIMADGDVMVMLDSKHVNSPGTEVELGAFICTAPFGLENLVALASATPFESLKTKRSGGIDVLAGSLSDALSLSKKSGNLVTQQKISINTIAK